MITGYFRVHKTADVQKLHLRYIPESGCMDTDQCVALRADEVHFVGLQDAYLVTNEILKSWGYNAKINKQVRIILDEEKTGQLLTHLKSKPNQVDSYIKETKRLEPREEISRGRNRKLNRYERFGGFYALALALHIRNSLREFMIFTRGNIFRRARCVIESRRIFVMH